MTITKKQQTKSQNHPVELGHFVQEVLVTDSVVYEIIKVTDKSITLRTTKDGRTMSKDDPMVVLTECVSDEDGRTFTLRLRKNGTFRRGNHARAGQITMARTFDGVPVRKTDYSF